MAYERAFPFRGRDHGNADPARALDLVKRTVMMCDFKEHPVIKEAIEQNVPVTMPRLAGSLGFDVRLWVGLGMVSLWAALDGFSERAGLVKAAKTNCPTCRRRRCISHLFAPYAGGEKRSLDELDNRHLYVHHYAFEADDEYFRHSRHFLVRDVPAQLSCGAHFNGRQLALELRDLRAYAATVQRVLGAAGRP
jgi:hypothetical protein